jgi:hypothetical protein
MDLSTADTDDEHDDVISRLPLYLGGTDDLNLAIELFQTKLGVEAGMTEQQVIAKFGLPSNYQTQRFDGFYMTYVEWANYAGTVSVQFQDNGAKGITFIPNS